MDPTFKDRVDKVFGSISSSSSSTSTSTSTPWSLSDAQVEKRVWNRDKGDDRDDDETIVSSCFHKLFNGQRHRRKPLDEYDDDQPGGDDAENDGDEWDVRSSIGLDSTLDHEEEEDAYDKMAEGRENAGDRLYMKDVTEHGSYLNSHNVLPSSVDKDPRANHDAARTRLKEDDADEPMLNACATEDGTGTRIKSILKRKSDVLVKSAKRVRFDSMCKKNENTIQLQTPEESENKSGVPDYMLNPSKYTRYSFDGFSHDVNKGSNREAYLDFVQNSKHAQRSGDLPKSLVFIPRKKRGDSEGQLKQSSTQAGSGIGIGIGIAAGEVQQGENSEMQEDESPACPKARFQKTGRRYRTKMEADDDVF